METPLFRETVIKSLDKDLADMVYRGMSSASDAMALQMLRLMRGRPHQVVETTVQGWSPDGKTWYPSEPGTVTTADGQVAPPKGE